MENETLTAWRAYAAAAMAAMDVRGFNDDRNACLYDESDKEYEEVMVYITSRSAGLYADAMLAEEQKRNQPTGEK